MENKKSILKPTTLTEQLTILKKRNIIVPPQYETVLLQYGYYNLINGYKDPFIDKVKSNKLGQDYYKDGTSLQHIVELYRFDALLRQNLLYCIVTVETQIKSLISLHFSLRFGSSHWEYLTPNSFTKSPSKQYHVNKLINTLQTSISKFQNEKKHPAICHFMNTYNQVPLWVLNTIMEFGKMSNFYDDLPDDMQKTIAKEINPNLTPKKLISILYYLTSIRNKCAHNNRLYIHKMDQRASRVSMIPQLLIHQELNIPYNDKINQYQYGQDDILAAILCLSVFFDQTKMFVIDYEGIETSLRNLSKNIPNDAAVFVREITGLHENILKQLHKKYGETVKQ
ncbi:Abi family protein [Dialister pneumosintes]|nr:Abi family protein [Dialister pneumosintes]